MGPRPKIKINTVARTKLGVYTCHLPVELEHKAYWAIKFLNFDIKVAGEGRLLQLNELDEFRL